MFHTRLDEVNLIDRMLGNLKCKINFQVDRIKINATFLLIEHENRFTMVHIAGCCFGTEMKITFVLPKHKNEKQQYTEH